MLKHIYCVTHKYFQCRKGFCVDRLFYLHRRPFLLVLQVGFQARSGSHQGVKWEAGPHLGDYRRCYQTTAHNWTSQLPHPYKWWDWSCIPWAENQIEGYVNSSGNISGLVRTFLWTGLMKVLRHLWSYSFEINDRELHGTKHVHRSINGSDVGSLGILRRDSDMYYGSSPSEWVPSPSMPADSVHGKPHRVHSKGHRLLPHTLLLMATGHSVEIHV